MVPPKYRPLERFWPYAELPEQPTDEELAALDPDLHDALFGSSGRPFTITLVFPDLDVPQFARALELAREAVDFRQVGTGEARRFRVRFLSSDAVRPQATSSVRKLSDGMPRLRTFCFVAWNAIKIPPCWNNSRPANSRSSNPSPCGHP